MSTFTVYILECADGTYYTGIAKDVDDRVRAHNTADTGAKYTRGRRPVRLVYSEECASRATAQKREYAIKQLSKAEKRQMILAANGAI